MALLMEEERSRWREEGVDEGDWWWVLWEEGEKVCGRWDVPREGDVRVRKWITYFNSLKLFV